MRTSNPRAIGVLQILLSGFCFGFLGVFGKGAFARGLTPGEVLSLRFTLAGILLFAYLILRAPHRLRLKRREVSWSIVLGVLGYAVFSYCYFQALNGLSVSLTVLLLYMFPIMVAIGARIFLNEHIPRERWLILPVAMIGLVMLVWGELYVRSSLALVLGIAAAFFYSIYILCSRRTLANADSLGSAAYMQLSAGLTIGAFNWRDPAHLAQVIGVGWPYLLGLALLCSIGAMSLFLAGLKQLKSWEASILSTSEPVTAIALAFLVLDERLTIPQMIGAVLVLVSLVVVSIPAKATVA